MLTILGRSRKTEITTISGPALALFIVFLAGGGITTAVAQHPVFMVAGALLGLYFLFAIKVDRFVLPNPRSDPNCRECWRYIALCFGAF